MLLNSVILCSPESIQIERSNKISTSSSTQDREHSPKEYSIQNDVPDGYLDRKQADTDGSSDSRSDGGDVKNNRPISPGTLALMCDEKDMMLGESFLSNGVINSRQNTLKSSNGLGCTEDHAEQEKRILAGFCDCLSRLITRGSIRGKFLSLFNSNILIVTIY